MGKPRRVFHPNHHDKKSHRPKSKSEGIPSLPAEGQLDFTDEKDFLQSRLTLILIGNLHTGGDLEFWQNARCIKRIHLPPSPWAVLAALFSAALTDDSNYWLWAYITTQSLMEFLKHHEVSQSPTKQTVYKLISQLRFELSPHFMELDSLDQKSADSLIKHVRLRGYRITLPPPQLRLVSKNPIAVETRSEC